MRRSVFTALAVIFAMVALFTPFAQADQNGAAGVIPPRTRVGGQTYGQWSAKWWQWALESQNVSSNPVVAQAGTASAPQAVDCTMGQSGNVWYLAGFGLDQPQP